MKKYVSILFLSFLTLVSCMEIDNRPAPDETLKGTLIDKTTGEPLITESQGVQIRLEELSWSDTSTPLDFPCKEDGSFFNSKLFKGTYRVTPRAGAFLAWPDKGGEVIDIKGVTSINLEVDPNLSLKIVDYQQLATGFTISCKIVNACSTKPITDVKVFVNNTAFVGEKSYINQSGWDKKIEVGDVWTNVKDQVYTFAVDNLLPHRTYYMRVGARVDDEFKAYNYTEVKEIVIP